MQSCFSVFELRKSERRARLNRTRADELLCFQQGRCIAGQDACQVAVRGRWRCTLSWSSSCSQAGLRDTSRETMWLFMSTKWALIITPRRHITITPYLFADRRRSVLILCHHCMVSVCGNKQRNWRLHVDENVMIASVSQDLSPIPKNSFCLRVQRLDFPVLSPMLSRICFYLRISLWDSTNEEIPKTTKSFLLQEDCVFVYLLRKHD